MKNNTKTEKQLQLPEETLVKARERARFLGLTLNEYVQVLVDKDIKTKDYDPWFEPIPKEVDELWEKDIAETEEYEKRHPRRAAKTADELIHLLDEEAADLPDDEGN